MDSPPKSNVSAATQAFGGLIESVNRPVYAYAAERLNPAAHQNFLEIGFGNGALFALIAAKISKGLIAGVEPSPSMVQTARQRLKARNLDLRVGDCSRLPWPDETFHKAAAIHCFHFWSNPESDLNEVLRVLRPGALFLLVLRDHAKRTSTAKLPNPISDGRDEVANTIRALERAGFVQIKEESKQGTSSVITSVRPQ